MKRMLWCVLSAALLVSQAGAQTYDISWYTIDGGGALNTTGGSFALSGTVGQPDAGGPSAGGSFAVHSGFWAFLAGGGPTSQADLALTKNDGLTTVVPGQPIAYTIVVTNAGPAAANNATVVDAPPGSLTSVSWTCVASAGSACPPSGSGAINHTASVAVGGTLTYMLSATLSPSASGTLANTAMVVAPGGTLDPNPGNNAATDTDTITLITPGAKSELGHGSLVRGDLAAVAGVPDTDLFRLRQQPFASYEIAVDETSGDIGLGQGPFVERVAADGSTVLQASQAVGSGPSRSLRWMNTTGASVDAESVRVRSASCTSTCGADDVYRLRAWETTGQIPRFNNSASQITVVILQNPTSQTVSARIAFWSSAGVLLYEQPVSLGPWASLNLNTLTIPALVGQGGSITVMHDAPYGALAGKAVALEPATGFAFDSVMTTRQR